MPRRALPWPPCAGRGPGGPPARREKEKKREPTRRAIFRAKKKRLAWGLAWKRKAAFHFFYRMPRPSRRECVP